MKQDQINKIAARVFEKVPGAKKAFVTSDGHGFSNKNSAELHQSTNPKGKKLELYEVNKTGAPSKPVQNQTENKDENTDKDTVGKANPQDRGEDDLPGEKEKAAAKKAEEDAAKKKAQAAARKKAAAAKKKAEAEAKKKAEAPKQDKRESETEKTK